MITDSVLDRLLKLAGKWIDQSSYSPHAGEIVRDETMNECGEELLELLNVLKKERDGDDFIELVVVKRWNV